MKIGMPPTSDKPRPKSKPYPKCRVSLLRDCQRNALLDFVRRRETLALTAKNYRHLDDWYGLSRAKVDRLLDELARAKLVDLVWGDRYVGVIARRSGGARP